MFKRFLAAAALAAALAASGAAYAGAYSAEYVFGDSLSDNGNLAEVYFKQNLPNPPSYHDSFSNGPVAVQLLANSLGLALNPSLWLNNFTDSNGLFGSSFVPGTNYAVAGATAAVNPTGGVLGINLSSQVNSYSDFVIGSADPSALYVIDIGGNDVRDAALYGTAVAAVTAGVQAELGAIQTLAREGAKNFLVVNAPNVGIIPEFAQDNPTLAAVATSDSQAYNAQLATGIAGLSLGDVNLTQFDLYGFNAGILANAASYGLTNTTDPCYINTPTSAATTQVCGTNAANISQFVYWDAIHPTEHVQALWANGFKTALGVSVPEPSSLALLSVGLLGLLFLRLYGKSA